MCKKLSAKEKADHKAAKDKLVAFDGIDPEVHHTMVTELEETKAQLEAVKKDGTIDEYEAGADHFRSRQTGCGPGRAQRRVSPETA